MTSVSPVDSDSKIVDHAFDSHPFGTCHSDQTPDPEDHSYNVMREMVLETIAEYDLPPLTGKRHPSSSHCVGIQKRAWVKYNH